MREREMDATVHASAQSGRAIGLLRRPPAESISCAREPLQARDFVFLCVSVPLWFYFREFRAFVFFGAFVIFVTS